MSNEPLKSIRKCEVCGKSFIIHPGAGWLYKKKTNKRTLWFCSWTCQRQAEQKGTK